jgi:hypothetical protein
VLFLSLIFCKQEEKILFFGSVSGCTCLILQVKFNMKCTMVSSTNKTDHHDITEILLKVALSCITLALNP